MPPARLLAGTNFTGFEGNEEMLVKRTIKLAPPPRLQLRALIRAENVRELIESASLVFLSWIAQAHLATLVTPPPHRAATILTPPAHQLLTMTKPRRTPMFVAFKS